MANVIHVDFKEIALRDAKFATDTADEVRVRCKELLDEGDYEYFLLSIMDEEYYANADEDIQNLVDAYFDRIPL